MATLYEAITQIMERVDVDKTLQTMGLKLKQRFEQEGVSIDPKTFIVSVIDEIDPTPNSKYTLWIIRLYIRGGIQRAEDIYKLAAPIEAGPDGEEMSLLAAFDKYKSKLDAKYSKDVGQYRRLSDFIDAAMTLQGEKSGKEASAEQDAEMEKEAKVYLNNERYKVVAPETEAAACHFGKNTQWCTSAKNNNAFSSYYDENNPLFIILEKKTGKRWQFQWSTEQFMDERDEPVNLYNFFKKHPEILKVDNFNEYFEFTDEGYVLRIPF